MAKLAASKEKVDTRSARHLRLSQRLPTYERAAYQNARSDVGRAPKTIKGEVSVLRQVLRHARLWYRFQEDYCALKNTKPPVGQALTDEDQEKLFSIARSEPRWLFAYVADDGMAVGVALAAESGWPAKSPFHDGRHTALTRFGGSRTTRLGYSSGDGPCLPGEMKTYSHIRRKGPR